MKILIDMNLQVRTQDVMSEALHSLLLNALQQFATELKTGAIVSIDAHKTRARVLPLS